MSVLTPVLQPPEVKEYLSKGERFIKWDDVSIETSLGWVVCVVTMFWSGLRGGWECLCGEWGTDCCFSVQNQSLGRQLMLGASLG